MRACAKCEGACCKIGWRPFTQQDIEFFLEPESPVRVRALAIMSENELPQSEFKMDGVCAFLEEDGCALGDRKPELCRDWYCEPARQHLDGFITEDQLISTVARPEWQEELLLDISEGTHWGFAGLTFEEFLGREDERVLNEAAPPDPDIEEWIVSMKKVVPKKQHWKLFSRAWSWFKNGQKPFNFKNKTAAKDYITKHYGSVSE